MIIIWQFQMYLMSLLFPGRLASKQKEKKDIRDYQKDLNKKYVHSSKSTSFSQWILRICHLTKIRLPYRAKYSNAFIQNISWLKLENM